MIKKSYTKIITKNTNFHDPKIITNKLQPIITPKNHIHEKLMEITTIWNHKKKMIEMFQENEKAKEAIIEEHEDKNFVF